MKDIKNTFLVAIDSSEASFKAVRYVAGLLTGRRDIIIDLLHMLPPLPPSLLEFGGSEDPSQEAKGEVELHGRQDEWVKEQCAQAEPLFKQASGILEEAGVPARCIRSRYCTCAHRQEMVRSIIDAAKANHCGTIIVGRTAFHGLHKLFGHHVSDQLIHHCRDLTVWVVE